MKWHFIVSIIASFGIYFSCIKIPCIYKIKSFLGGMHRVLYHVITFFINVFKVASITSFSTAFCLMAQAPADPLQCSLALAHIHTSLQTSPASLHLAQPSFHVLCSTLFPPWFSVCFSFYIVCCGTPVSVVFRIKITLVAKIDAVKS